MTSARARSLPRFAGPAAALLALPLLACAEAGSVWLRWAQAPADSTGSGLLLDASGEPRATFDLPSKLRLLAGEGSTSWAVETDALGVPYVVRPRLREAPR